MSKLETDENPILERGAKLLFTFLERRGKGKHAGQEGIRLEKELSSSLS
jgi:hypothetical protein